MATFQNYLDTISGNDYRIKARIELLRRADETVYQTIESEIISGSYNVVNENGVRRTCTLVLDNEDGQFIPNEYNLWINNQFNLSFGIDCNPVTGVEDDYYFVKAGSYVIQNPVLDSSMSANTITISGIDKYAFLNGTSLGILESTYIIPLGTDIPTAVQGILDKFNILKTPVIHSSYTGKTLPYDIREAYSNPASNLIARLYGWQSTNTYFNTDGRFVYEPDFDDSTKGAQWDFKAGDFHYKGAKQTLEYDKVKNKIVVIGNNISGVTAAATVENTNLQSPTRTQLIGEKVEVIEDSVISTVSEATIRAEYELKRKMILYFTATVDSVAIFHLDVDKVVTLTNPKQNLDKERVLINSISISFGKGVPSMTLGVVKTSDLVIS